MMLLNVILFIVFFRVFFVFVFMFGVCIFDILQQIFEEIECQEVWVVNVEILCDDFGVLYIYGKMDVDVVFGLFYVQVEDDFLCVECNYIWVIGCLVEVFGEDVFWSDL